MQNPTIERGSNLHDDIERLQLALCDAGFEVDIDAQFGPGVKRVVCEFQKAKGLEPDGVVAEKTWAALAKSSQYGRPLKLDVAENLPGFRGDLTWIHRWEGHAGKPYWPGGASGVTLDPGLDLGHADPELVEGAFGSHLSTDQKAAVRAVLGKRGEEAKAALGANRVLQTIRILRTMANQAFPYVARPYWRSLGKRFETLPQDSTPAQVHTAMLSLAYNRGAGNKALKALQQPIAVGDWRLLGELIADMQQDHSLQGIRRRRRAEGELILSALPAES
ncbi:MAG: peptidoglycan-binding protein [Acidobacteriota bacterium]